MSNEIFAAAPPGQTCYALLFLNGQYFNGTTLEDFASGGYSNYDIAMTEDGSTGNYFADFPAVLTGSGTYEYVVKVQIGGSPAQSDTTVATGNVDWSGTVAVSPTPGAVGSMSGSDWRNYVLRGGFIRTDKDTELYEETTDAIQEMRRRFMFDEAEVDTTTTDTISTLGTFRLDLEDDFGLVLGVIIQDDDTGTPLIQKTKHEFDNLYSDIFVSNDRGYPQHFTIYDGQIYIGPIPDQTSYTYRISYSQRAGTITSTTATVPFTKDYRDILRSNVLGRLWMLMDDFDKAAIFKQNFELGFDHAKSRERNNSSEGHFYVKPFGM